MKQNYFCHNDSDYDQTNGLTMGAPTLALFADIFRQYIEHNYILPTLVKHHIISRLL
jgi:hypothetical protein